MSYLLRRRDCSYSLTTSDNVLVDNLLSRDLLLLDSSLVLGKALVLDNASLVLVLVVVVDVDLLVLGDNNLDIRGNTLTSNNLLLLRPSTLVTSLSLISNKLGKALLALALPT